MATKMVKHGTEAGYKKELKGQKCPRCSAAHRVYNRQFAKSAGPRKYSANDVIDHLDNGPRTGRVRQGPTGTDEAGQGRATGVPTESQPGSVPPEDTGQGRQEAHEDAQGQPGPTLADRLRDGLFTLRAERKGTTYVESDEPPDYLHESELDPEPGSGDWSEVKGDEFLVTADGLRLIRDNLGMYVVTVGMTLELIDPYCGSALRENLDDMVDGWARVISHYPSAAKLFMSKGGGKIMAWIDALIATWPILVAIYEHHFARTVQLDSLGRAIRVTPDMQNANGHFATQPDFKYTVD